MTNKIERLAIGQRVRALNGVNIMDTITVHKGDLGFIRRHSKLSDAGYYVRFDGDIRNRLMFFGELECVNG